MDDRQLNARLKSAPGPRFEPQYEDLFVRSVLANLRSAPAGRLVVKYSWRLRLVWGCAAAACVLLALLVGIQQEKGRANGDVLANTKLIEETLALFPHRVRAIVQDQGGLRLVLSETTDVPSSPPIYVRLCDGHNCSSAVTFSGQEIQVGGQKLTVLADGDGGVILEGSHFAWSSGARQPMDGKIQIRVKTLDPAAM